MKFRHLYWVTEQLNDEGRSQVTGVYTSIPELELKGLQWCDQVEHRAAFRLSLVKLDCPHKPLGVWMAPDFAQMHEDLQAFVQSRDFEAQEVERLMESVNGFGAPMKAAV